MHTEDNTITLASEKRQSFLARLRGQEIGGKTQICLSNQEFGVELKGLGKDEVGWYVEALVGQVSLAELWN